MKRVTRQSSHGAKGFTLFELVLAIAIGAFVLASIFKIADGAVRSTAKMVDIQDEDITRDAFFTFLRNHFDSLPGNAVLDLRNTSDSKPYTSELTFQNTPVSFNWGGVPVAAEATRIITVRTPSNGLDIVLEYYDEKILDSDEGPAERGVDPIASVTLLRDVRYFEWGVLDIKRYDTTERDAWEYEWDNAQLPGFVELTILFEYGDAPVKRLFWIPKKSNPKTIMSALQNTARSARANAEGAAGGGAGGVGTRNPQGGPSPGPGGNGNQPRGGRGQR